MRELFSLKKIALAAAFVAAFALVGLGAARLLPVPSYTTATIAAINGVPAEGELEGIALDLDARLADRGLPARVTATRTKISIMVPPSSKDPTEIQAILTDSLDKLPLLGLPPSRTQNDADRLQAKIEKIHRAEEVVARQADQLTANEAEAAVFDFDSYARAVMILANESDRLAAILDAHDPSMSTIAWGEPNVTSQVQRVSGPAFAAVGGAFGLLLFAVVAIVMAARNRPSAS